jgi:hypothetical protein
MADQQDMLAYVKNRMAGTEQPPPPPGPSPMAGYVLAQGARGATVPRATMMDSDQYLVSPDTGDEPVYQGVGPNAVETTKQPHLTRQADLLRQMEETRAAMDKVQGTPAFGPLYDRFMALYDAHRESYKSGPVGKLIQKEDQIGADAKTSVGDIQEGADARRAAPRQPLAPPAPGGVPLNAPPVPYAPSAGPPMS